MKRIYIKYNIDLKNTNKILVKRNKVKDPFTLINSKVKLVNNITSLEKKIIGVELIPTYKYNTKLDLITTNKYYTSVLGDIDIYTLKKDFNSYDNNLVILTVV